MLKTSVFRSVVAAAIATVSLMAVSPAVAGSKRAPLGYQIMCLKTPAECRGGGSSSVSMTDDLLAILKRVNSRVNGSIAPRADRTDVWSASASSGDCEDYVLAKRRALIKAGVPANALRIAQVKTRGGEGHAILVVKAGGKDLVLDNLTSSIKPLSQTGYRVVSMQTANPLVWS